MSIVIAGERCEQSINECVSNPCKNNAPCLDYVNMFKCICPGGWTGKFCDAEINECMSSPCKNEGQCHDLPNGYRCTCKLGFNGTNCEINLDVCANRNPCQNGATCTNGGNIFTCACARGFTGATCDKRIGDCADPPSIINGRSTQSSTKSYVLYKCNDGFKTIGIRFLRCMNGNWIGNPPTCQYGESWCILKFPCS